MKRFAFIIALFAAAPLCAQDAIPKDFQYGEFSLGVIQKDVDTNSSKFLEYKDIPNGMVVPLFTLQGSKNGFRYSLYAQDVTQTDQRYGWDLSKSWFRFSGFYTFVPHAFGNDAKSPETNLSEGVFQVSNTLQATNQAAIAAVPGAAVTYPFLNALITPTMNAQPFFDLNYQRQASRALVTLNPSQSVEIKAGYFNELRKGYRGGAGTAFGFNNVVETPDQTRYVTEDIGADIQFTGSWGMASAGVHYNWFRNNTPTLDFDNPWRVTDSTNANAYQSPSSSSTAGPSYGRVALPPDNNAFIANAATSLKLGKKSRLYANISYSDWTQNETPFIAYSTNTAINPTSNPAAPFVVTNPAVLPASQLDGKINVTAFNAGFNTRPTDKLNINLRYRLYDLANDTVRIAFPGYVRFDAVWEAIPRINVPYAYKNNRFDATIDYDIGKVTLEAGYHYFGFDREFRETEKTTENGFNIAATVPFSDKANLKVNYEFGSRSYSGLEIENSEDASFLNPGAPTNIYAFESDLVCTGGTVCNLRYDQAPRDSNRFTALLQLTPHDKWSFDFSYVYGKYDFTDSYFGLTSTSYDSFTAEADFTASEKTSLYFFYTYESYDDSLRGRQSGATVSTNPLDDWTSDVNDKTNTIGAGANFTLVPDKWTLNLFGRWQDLDGYNDFYAPPGGAPANARVNVGGVKDIPDYDDANLLGLNLDLKWQLAKKWAVTFGAWFEDYSIKDSNTDNLPYYVPGSFFLAGNNGDYQAVWGYLNLSYSW